MSALAEALLGIIVIACIVIVVMSFGAIIFERLIKFIKGVK